MHTCARFTAVRTIRRWLSRHLRLWRTLAFTSLVSAALAGCGLWPVPAEQGEKTPAPVKISDGRELLWSGDIKQQALAMIRASRHRLYVDIYECSDPDLLHALLAASRRGVEVRVVLDATEKHSMAIALPTLAKAGIDVAPIRIKQGIDHVKMIIADADVLIGGMNFGADSWANHDASVDLPGRADIFLPMFMWDAARAHGETAEAPQDRSPLISDRDIGPCVLRAIRGARREIDMEAFNLTDEDVVNALRWAVERGVSVNVLVDPSQSRNRTAVEALRQAGALVRYYRPYGGELLHAKILDVDHGAVFIIGSANFTHQAFTYNHEADVELTRVPAFAEAFESDLHHQIARGSSYPIREKVASWDES
ncbi:phospholipase D/Transphosphatidylase [Alicyclobacillus acidocaldarius subsp. acidocaldarius DSM 446]|uniref:phospholipase D n=1 Tax=Alicyclobacillus acidocaldarius subsp. acidocaldarius (strain ATCC 27009 / DSM 446 / BCRC 14685 / JCM 5260 / KCTC 1825 / NBRC 15652 / NCIMB 11725 / NRRL B-14509 / 104-IA) TaxID=521098 RepID=C8WVC6_ALIAD|nr:phospholipase D/Transphosphatidylase [Alicyclobacillus acidocaldarius subsp. acidocaldarius DSM 446]